jgi:C4-dicarboxylate-specific signal transduction histidine kinase
MAHVFEPFVSTKKEAGSIGIDLAICNATMMRMNGAIDVRNDESGAIFTIVLTMAEQSADAGDTDED